MTSSEQACHMNFLGHKSHNPFKKPDADGAMDQEPPGPAYAVASSNANINTPWVPPADILEGQSEYLFKIDLPGVKKSELRVVRERTVLLVSGKRGFAHPEDEAKALRLERPHGYFIRRFVLPDNASREQIKAQVAEGILKIHVRKTTLGKLEQEYPTRQEVNICSQRPFS
ncbi:MAG: Hsp20/alpha crystallin family protein [Verrucomicrobiae bacterium]|nr:Hsp20/alpha crystallin family protein [Verrucomicrobiae bacterium]